MVSKKNHKVVVIAEVIVELKVVIKGKVHVEIVEPVTHSRCPGYGKKCHTVMSKDTTKSPLQIS